MAHSLNERRNPEQTWSGASWVAAISALLMLIFAFSSVAHRYRLPTDGWSMIQREGSFNNTDALMVENVMGFPSNLRPGDVLLQIGGKDVDPDHLPLFGIEPPLHWNAGQLAVYRVKRGNEILNLLIPLGHWEGNRYAAWLATRMISVVPGLAYAILASLVFSLRPGNRSAQVLLFMGAVNLAMNAGQMTVPLSSTDFFDPFAFISVNFLDYFAWGVLLFPTITLLTLVFPKPKWFFQRYPGLVLLLLYGATLFLFILTGWSRQVGWGMVALFALLALVSAIHSFLDARRDPIARAQVGWVLMGLSILLVWRFFENIVLILLISQNINVDIGGTGAQILEILSTLAFPITLAIAILRYRLFDIDVIIRRTLVYALLTITLGGVYIGGIVLLQQVFRIMFGQESSLAIVISTLAIAAMFNPLRQRMQEVINRRFYRQRYNAESALVSFSAASRSEVDLGQLSDRLLLVVDETIQPEHAELWIRRVGSS
jgi:hypothetical protein